MKTTKILLCYVLLLFTLFNVSITLQAQSKGYGEASYSNLSDNEPMKNWMLLGPVKIKTEQAIPDEKVQKEAFDKDILTTIKVNPKKELTKVAIQFFI